MDTKISQVPAHEQQCDALVLFIPFKEHAAFEVFRSLDEKMQKALSRLLKQEQFQGKLGEVITFHTHYNSVAPRRIILSGLGKREQISEEMFRRSSAAAVAAARRAAAATVAFTLPSESLNTEALAGAVADGALLGSYRYTKFKTKEEELEPNKKVDSVVILAGKGKGIQQAVSRARVYAEATCFARDLVNEPANNVNPQALADITRKEVSGKGFSVRVLEKPELEKLGAGAILGVGSGSSVPPRLIQINYRSGRKKAKKIALVGKGITFDSGGLSLKTAKYMETMKCDMAGAAAVLSTLRALPSLGCKYDVVGILCAAENMPSGSAIRPGDVLTAMNGRSIEVINTDAEGRLVLADGISWAVRQKAEVIIDLATLTGACVIGLGPYIAGAMGNDTALIDSIIESGNRVGESYWRLPVPDEYDFMVKSDIADIKNLAHNSEAGAIQGALFLREFTGNAKWAHLDIAGPAWYDKEFYHIPKNGTGFGVRTLLDYLTH